MIIQPAKTLCVSYVGNDKPISASLNNLLILTVFDMLDNK